MTDETPNRRKQNERQPSALSSGAKLNLELAADRVAAAEKAGIGTPEGLALAQEAIGYTAFAVGRHLEAAFPTAEMSDREQWLTILRFLSGTLMFQWPLEMLTLALTDLDRGVVQAGLQKSRNAQGGAPNIRKLTYMRTAVELADVIFRQHGGRIGEAELCMESEAGVSPSTIRRWRRQLVGLAVEHHPRSRPWLYPEVKETEEMRRLRLGSSIEALKRVYQEAKKNISTF